MAQYGPPKYYAPWNYQNQTISSGVSSGVSSGQQIIKHLIPPPDSPVSSSGSSVSSSGSSASSSVSSAGSSAKSSEETSASPSASPSASSAVYSEEGSYGESPGSPSSGSSSDDESFGYKNTIARHLDDPRYAIIRAADGSVNSSNLQDYSKTLAYSSLYTPFTPTSNSPLYFNPKKRVNSTLFSFKSDNRDKSVYPSQAYFTLKTPRVYKNVSQIQLVQISFQYFLNNVPDISQGIIELIDFIGLEYGIDPSDCLACVGLSSVSANGVAMQELGRNNPTDNTPLTHAYTVRPGAYSANTLVEELNQQMNTTPPFRILSYTDHRNQFHTTKTLHHLFNNPSGASIRKTIGTQIVPGISKQDFINYYFGNNNALSSFIKSEHPSEQEIFVAYYFPILKEAVADNILRNYLDIGGVANENELEQRVLHSFEGLSSSLYLRLCSTNRSFLHTARRSYTFEYGALNRYEWEYFPNANRIGVRFTDLHPALRSDIREYHANVHSQLINRVGHSASSFTALQQSNNQTKAILTDLHRVINNSLTTIGVPFAQYPVSYLGSNTNYISSSTGLLTGSESDSHLMSLATGGIVAPTVPGVVPARGSTNLTFGWTTLAELNTESTFPGGYTYIAGYQSTLNALNTASATITHAGSNYINGYGGTAVSVTGFSSLYSTFLSYYSTYTSNISTINGVVGSGHSMTSNYVHNTYGAIIPQGLLGNSCNINGEYLRLGSVPGVKFLAKEDIVISSSPFGSTTSNSCCSLLRALLGNVYSCLPPGTLRNTVFQRVGFDLENIIAFYSTIAVTDPLTTYNVYLQMNIEKSMNNMDVAMNENFNVTNESTAETKVVLGKLLTEGSGLQDITQTIIQQPAQFDPPLGKIDKFEFQLLLGANQLIPIDKLFPFELEGSEWDAVIQIDEEVPTLDRDVDLTTVPTVEWPPDERPF